MIDVITVCNKLTLGSVARWLGGTGDAFGGALFGTICIPACPLSIRKALKFETGIVRLCNIRRNVLYILFLQQTRIEAPKQFTISSEALIDAIYDAAE